VFGASLCWFPAYWWELGKGTLKLWEDARGVTLPSVIFLALSPWIFRKLEQFAEGQPVNINGVSWIRDKIAIWRKPIKNAAILALAFWILAATFYIAPKKYEEKTREAHTNLVQALSFSNKVVEEIRKTTTPSFSTAITDNITVGFSINQDSNAIPIIFPFYVLNRGAPSTTLEWRCDVRLLSGQVVSSGASPFRRIEAGDTNAPYSTTNYLPALLCETPLGTGAGKSGWVGFVFPAGVIKEIKRPGVVFEVSFEDAQRNKTTHRWIVPVGYQAWQ
jgi:hypothetical protein